MKKHSFTLAETLVTLTILGIIMAIVMPLINKAKPDKDIIIFKKGLYTIQSAVGNATEVLINQGALSNEIWRSNIVNNNPTDPNVKGFCKRIADHLNTSAENCDIKNSSYDDPQIVTTDGIRFWHIPNEKIENNDYICFDRGLTDKELSTLEINRTVEEDGKEIKKAALCGNDPSSAIGFNVLIRWDGKVYVGNDDDYAYERYLVERSFEVQKRD